MIAHLRLALAVGLMFSFFPAWGQQLPLFTQYREHHGHINPAFPSQDYFVNGLPDRMIKVGGGQRLQWVASDVFTVSTSVLHGEGFFNLGNVALLGGGYFMHDEVDVTTMDGFYGRGAVYVGNIDAYNANGFWGGIGFNAGYVSHSIDLRKLKAYEAGDDLLAYDYLTDFTPDLGVGCFGIYYWDSYDKMLMMGISAPQLLEFEVAFEDSDKKDYSYTRLRHFYGQLSFISNTSQDFGFFEASLWGKYVQGLTPHIDLNLRYQFSSPFSVGLGGSTNGAVHFEAGANIPVGKTHRNDRSTNYLKVGVSSAFPFNPNYSTQFGLTHEVNLSYVIF